MTLPALRAARMAMLSIGCMMFPLDKSYIVMQDRQIMCIKTCRTWNFQANYLNAGKYF